MTERRLSRAMIYEASHNEGRNGTDNPAIGDLIASRFNRRDLLKGVLATAAIGSTIGSLALSTSPRALAAATTRFGFSEIEIGIDDKHHVAPGYTADILVRWGDPVYANAPAFDPAKQTAAAQSRQFGYNNDYIGYFPIEGSSEHGLLCVNHEYTNENLMFPGLSGEQDGKDIQFKEMTPELAAIEMAAHGGSIIEIIKEGGRWTVVKDSKFARRITANTEMEITGPAAGHDLLKTSADATGTKVIGMVNNCAGGMTPWGTWLTAEENFHGYFWGKAEEGHPHAKSFKRYGVPSNAYSWGVYDARFDVVKEPNEANRFGYMIEIDPFDPQSTPKKRTALGRVKHEGAESILNKDGRAVCYMGDDERFDYLYRFVTEGKVNAADRAANMSLLDSGTLSVAKFSDSGDLEWLTLTHGQGKLTAENGFAGQADILINTRLAADLVGATKMDRPEDVQANPVTQKVYVMLTNNTKRKADQIDAANPRAENAFGHIIEMTPPDGDHAADKYKWEVLVRCGDPSVAEVGATFSSATTQNGWFGMPDNCAIDAEGRLWIATDGNSKKETGRTDGLWALETDGEARGTSKLFFRVPVGAEMCGPAFTPDGKTLFLAVQHPGESDAGGNAGSYENPPTRWPDFAGGMPPRPSVLVITKDDGGAIGA
ncbi:PhoX family phosphatase [soil metagenome]